MIYVFTLSVLGEQLLASSVLFPGLKDLLPYCDLMALLNLMLIFRTCP